MMSRRHIFFLFGGLFVVTNVKSRCSHESGCCRPEMKCLGVNGSWRRIVLEFPLYPSGEGTPQLSASPSLSLSLQSSLGQLVLFVLLCLLRNRYSIKCRYVKTLSSRSPHSFRIHQFTFSRSSYPPACTQIHYGRPRQDLCRVELRVYPLAL